MYDASFDHSPHSVPVIGRGVLWALRIAAVAAVFVAASAGAQMPGMPVLQNVWASPGLVGAVDLGGGSDGTTYAGAVGWTPSSGRFQVSAGLGGRSRTGAGSGGVYGARLALPFGGASSTFGFAAFAGIGGGSSTKSSTSTSPASGTASIDTTASTGEIPVGAAFGWRHAIGATHGISVYADPSWVFFTGGSKTGGLFRTAVGADLGITRSIGATLGVEFGGTRARGFGGPSGTLYGLGVSYAFGKR